MSEIPLVFTSRDNTAYHGLIGTVRVFGSKCIFNAKMRNDCLVLEMQDSWESKNVITLLVPPENMTLSGERMTVDSVPSDTAITRVLVNDGVLTENLSVTLGRLAKVSDYNSIILVGEWLNELVEQLNSFGLAKVESTVFWDDLPYTTEYALMKPPF